MRLVSRRRDNAVNATLQEPVGEEGEGIGNVDGDGSWVCFYPFPFTGWRTDLVQRSTNADIGLGPTSAYLQCRDRLAEQQRHTPKIGMALHPNILQFLVDLLCAVIVLHVPKMTVTLLVVAMTLQEEGFR
jgi:hypothetical protein